MKPYYESGGITLYHGDCREVMPRLPQESVGLFLTSPPYDDARTYGQVSPDDLEAIGGHLIRLMSPGAVGVWVIDGPVNDRARSTTPFEMVCRWARLEGWRFLECLIYGRLGTAGAYEGRFRKDHEYMPVFVRDGANHHCDKRVIAKKSTSVGSWAAKTVRRRDGSLAAREESGWAVENRMKMPGTIWEYGCVGKGHDESCETGHPATFAMKLVRDVLKVFAIPECVILDPFSGSGTTLRAAKDAGMRGVGVELEERWCEYTARRLEQGVFAWD